MPSAKVVQEKRNNGTKYLTYSTSHFQAPGHHSFGRGQQRPPSKELF